MSLPLWADIGAAVAIRFDDNHSPEKWRCVAELFEGFGMQCSFAVCSGSLTPEQGRCLKELSGRGFEIMDHASSHGMYNVQFARVEDFSKADTNLPFVAESNPLSLTIRCTADIDLQHELNLFMWASVSNGVLLCNDAGILPKLSWTKKVWIRSRKALFGIVMEEGQRELRDFYGRKVENFNEPWSEMILVHQAAIQPCQELLRMQASATRTNFDHFRIPRPKTWIQPGGWEAYVDARRLRDVYGAEFGYTGADCVMPFETCWSSTDQPVPDEWRLIAKAIDVQRRAWLYSKPGAWNDPDMLVLKGDHKKCRLTPNEQYTHISMWSLFAAPLLIGCNLAEADDFTLGLLSNPEIVEIDQDPLGAAAAPVAVNPFFEVWARPLEGGDIALGVFNPSGTQDVKAKISFYRDLGLVGTWSFRDVWRQRDMGDFNDFFEVELPAHMTYVFRISPRKDGRMLGHLSDIRNLAWQRTFELKRPIIMHELNANSPEPGGRQPRGFKFSP